MSSKAAWQVRSEQKIRRRGAATTDVVVEQPGAATAAAVDPSIAIGAAIRDERIRIKSIIEAPEAKGREESASELAFSTNLSASKSREMLAGMQLDANLQVDAIARKIVGHPKSATPRSPAR